MSFGIHMLENKRLTPRVFANAIPEKCAYALQGFACVTSPFGKTLFKHEHCVFWALTAFFDTTEVTDLS